MGASLSTSLGTGLRPIAVPLTLSGIDPGVAEPVLRVLRQAGFVETPGGRFAQPPQAAGTPPLRPGDAIGVSLISGDLEFGATGTVTEVVDGRVYAFGHPLYNIGPSRLRHDARVRARSAAKPRLLHEDRLAG